MRRQGFTLVELMTVLGVLGLAFMYVTRSFTETHRTYTVIDQVAESQQNLRGLAELLDADIRHAGFMVPEFGAVCGVDNANAPDLLYLSDSQAIDPGDDLVPYGGAEVQGGVTNVAGIVTLLVDSLIIEPSPSRPAYDTNGDGTPDSDFQVGGGAIIVDSFNPDRGSACGKISIVNLGAKALQIDLETGALDTLVGLAQLVVIPAHEYRVDTANFKLRRDGLLLASGVEDLQVAYFFDADDDNVVDAGEMHGVSGTSYDAQDQDASSIREVRANIVTRTRAEDANYGMGQPQLLENRTAWGGADGFRRRVYTSTSMLRNVGNRLVGGGP